MRLDSWRLYYRLIRKHQNEKTNTGKKYNRVGSIFWGKYTSFYGGWEVLHVTSAIMSLIKKQGIIIMTTPNKGNMLERPTKMSLSSGVISFIVLFDL